MPEDSKKNHDKKKCDPKEQRRPRQRHQQLAAEKKLEKKTEEPKNIPKVPQKPPVYESPPPEFYKNLKRETDEILKITEEENTKYKKKEIQSNWLKYEVPIESYEEIEEQENLGADYEKLIQAPLSIGGHFQFKHEKSWDMNTGPSLYDKYFDINMEDLNIALCTIPFYERNSIAETNFSQTDILTMNNRSTRFKQKYFNDKSYSTPETDAQDKILNNLRESMKDDHEKDRDTTNDIEIKYDSKNKTVPETEPTPVLATDIDLEFKNKTKTKPADNNSIKNIEKVIFKQEATINKIEPIPKSNIEKVVENIDDSIFGDTNKPTKELKDVAETPDLADKLVCHTINAPEGDSKETTVLEANELPTHPSITPTIPQHTVTTVTPIVPKTEAAVHKVAGQTPVETKKNPVIESPEDLEKWLDDFLDG